VEKEEEGKIGRGEEEGVKKRREVGFMIRSLIMFKNFIYRNKEKFLDDKRVRN
jgi:hypothetical protein